jgi:hypothetical protein
MQAHDDERLTARARYEACLVFHGSHVATQFHEGIASTLTDQVYDSCDEVTAGCDVADTSQMGRAHLRTLPRRN